MSSKSPNYHAYLLRLWRDHANAPWRVSLQSADTRERRHFADLANLLAYLEEQVEQPWSGEQLPDGGNHLSSEAETLTDSR
ncbi:MAG: hypothetical protein KDE56_25540 [Anaerolineales bacterium]|nr:hypothetical protein [Anaerolineales bacterium]